MHSNNDELNSYIINLANAGQAINSSAFNNSFRDVNSVRYIRFENKQKRFVWIHSDDICFVKSADHYVKALIRSGYHFYWMTKHSTLKDLLQQLPTGKFIRLNKFYLLNLHCFSHFNEKQKILYFKNDVQIAVPHRISPFMRQLLEEYYT